LHPAAGRDADGSGLRLTVLLFECGDACLGLADEFRSDPIGKAELLAFDPNAWKYDDFGRAMPLALPSLSGVSTSELENIGHVVLLASTAHRNPDIFCRWKHLITPSGGFNGDHG
jgi:hypothetical protein